MKRLPLCFFYSRIVIVSLILITTILPGAVRVQAQTDNTSLGNLGISPAIMEKVVSPEKVVNGSLEVFNLTNFPLPVKAFVTSFSPKDLIDIPENKRDIYDASKWISINEPDFILQAKSHRVISYTIRAPKSAEPGGHYATIFFQPLVPEQALSPQNLYIVERVGTLVLLTVPGDITENIKAANFSVPHFSQFGPVALTLALENTGNTHIRPRGKIEVINFQGKVIFSTPLNEGLVIPGTTKTYAVPFGNSNTFGKFYARATIIYGTDQQKITATSNSFWVIPYIPVIILVITAVLAVFFLFKIRRRLYVALQVLIGKETTINRPEKLKRKILDM